MASLTDNIIAAFPAEISRQIFLDYLDDALEYTVKYMIRTGCNYPPIEKEDFWIFNDHEYQKWLQGRYRDVIACADEHRRPKNNGSDKVVAEENPSEDAVKRFCRKVDAVTEAAITRPLPLSDYEQYVIWPNLVRMERFVLENGCRAYIAAYVPPPPPTEEPKEAHDAAHASCTAQSCVLVAQQPFGDWGDCPRRHQEQEEEDEDDDEDDLEVEQVFIEKKETPVDRLNAVMARYASLCSQEE